MLTRGHSFSSDDALATVEEELRALDDRTSAFCSSAVHAGSAANDLRETVSGAGAVPRRTWEAISSLNRVAACRTHDVELVVTEAHLNALLPPSQFDGVNFDQDGIRVQVTPAGRSVLRWAAGSGTHADGCLIDTPLRIAISGQTPRAMAMRVPATLVVGPSSARVKLTQTGAISFHDLSNGYQRIFPLDDIPLTSRRTIVSQLNDSVRLTMSRIELSLPNVPNLGQMRPHTFVFHRDLELIGRLLPRRRAPHALGSPVAFGFDRQLRLKQDHILPRVRDAVAAQGGSVTGIECRNGHIWLKVHKREQRSILWVDVTVDVDMEYAITIQEDIGGVLFLDANYTRWEYRIRIENCWPVCDRVKKSAREETLSEIRKRLHLTFPFVDLRSQGVTRAAAWVEPFGVRINMRAR